MATYVVNSASGITPGEFFPDAGVTRNARSATTATYTLPDGRVVVVSGTGFDPGAASPTTGIIAAVELRQGATVLVAFSGLTNVSLPTFDSHWLVTGSSFFPFSDLLTGNDTLTGNAGDDSFVGGLGDDAINGGAGFDEVVYHNDGRSAGVTVDLNDGDPSDNVGKAWAGNTPVPAPGVEIDALTAIEAALGTRFDDLLIGDDHDNTFAPGRGTDSVDGGAGFDELRYDRPGNVTSVGITVVFTADGLGTVIASSVTGDVNTSFAGIEGVRGTAQADMFTGAAGSQRFRGLGGNDTFDGGADDDEVDFLRDTNNPGGLGVTVALGDPALGGSASGPGGNDLLRNIERVRGTINGDNITCNSQGINGDRRADFQIELIGLKTLTKIDFIL
ncbi:MAG TPA: hypothetical protein VH743_08300 [Beijerinckiaceae bacterium]